MKWVEIIELRSAGNTRKQLEMLLQSLISQMEGQTERPTARLYTCLTVETDLGIHLSHDSRKAKNKGSSLGINLVAALKAYGLVNHTIWIEKPKDL